MTRSCLFLFCAWIAAGCSDDPVAANKDAAVTETQDVAAQSDLGLSGDATADTASTDINKYTGKCSGGAKICDDGNPCTEDDCDPVKGCLTTVKACVDNDLCTIDACDLQTGGCKHEADPCEDGNACTVGACLAGEGCTFTPVDCSDGDACTADGCAPKGGCDNTALNCDDGQTCTTDSCDTAMGCVHDKADPLAQCCETANDCDDGNPCTQHTCSAGVCATQGVFGCCHDDSECEDKNQCTTDVCNKGSGQCANVLQPGPGCCATDADCEDKVACTLDKCAGNACAHETICCATGADCGAVDLCGTPTCTTAGCAIQPAAGAGCCAGDVQGTGFESGATWVPLLAPAVNGQWLVDTTGTQGKTGTAALLYKDLPGKPIPGGGPVATAKFPEVTLPAGVGVTLQFNYRSQLSVTAVLRLKAVTSAGTWILWTGTPGSAWQKISLNLSGLAARPATRKVKLVLEVKPASGNGFAAFDDVAITSTCQAVTCTNAVSCNDNQAATADACAEGLCVWLPEKEYCEPGASCDDGNACTQDTCAQFKCQHTPKAKCCLATADCDDKDVCTMDACLGNSCQHLKKPAGTCCNTAADCDDANLCTQDLCPSVGLACEHTQADANCCMKLKDCDDGEMCTVDSCAANQCGHTNQCCKSDADCDDGDPVCTQDVCGADKLCTWLPVDATGCCAKDVFDVDFEAGLTDWLTLENGFTAVKWQVVTGKEAHGGTSALWYGNQVTGNFDDGAQNKGAIAMKPLGLPNGETLEFGFWIWMDTESGSYDDVTVTVQAGGLPVTLWKKSDVGLQMKAWQHVVLNLSAFAGKTVTIKIAFDSLDAIGNSSGGVYVDDVTLHRGCAAAACAATADCDDKIAATTESCIAGVCVYGP